MLHILSDSWHSSRVWSTILQQYQCFVLYWSNSTHLQLVAHISASSLIPALCRTCVMCITGAMCHTNPTNLVPSWPHPGIVYDPGITSQKLVNDMKVRKQETQWLLTMMVKFNNSKKILKHQHIYSHIPEGDWQYGRSQETYEFMLVYSFDFINLNVSSTPSKSLVGLLIYFHTLEMSMLSPRPWWVCPHRHRARTTHPLKPPTMTLHRHIISHMLSNLILVDLYSDWKPLPCNWPSESLVERR